METLKKTKLKNLKKKVQNREDKVLCDCDNPVRFYYDMTNNINVFTCHGIPNKKSSTKKVIDNENPTVYCKFRKTEENANPDFVIHKPPEIIKQKFVYIPKTQTQIVKAILLRIKYFRSDKIFVTLQELERNCKYFDIDFYKPSNETIYEFTVRIENIFRTMI